MGPLEGTVGNWSARESTALVCFCGLGKINLYNVNLWSLLSSAAVLLGWEEGPADGEETGSPHLGVGADVFVCGVLL